MTVVKRRRTPACRAVRRASMTLEAIPVNPMKQATYRPVSSRTADKFVLRLPDGMREKIAQVARTSHRSMNSEVIARLEQSLDADAGIATTNLNTATLSRLEQDMLKRFRLLASAHQKALIEIISVPLAAVGETDRAKCA